MDKVVSCAFNFDIACIEVKFADGSMISMFLSSPKRAFPILVFPRQEKPRLGKPEQENPAQLNTKESNSKWIKYLSINHSFIHSVKEGYPIPVWYKQVQRIKLFYRQFDLRITDTDLMQFQAEVQLAFSYLR